MEPPFLVDPMQSYLQDLSNLAIMLLASNLITESFKGNDSFHLDLSPLEVKVYPILGPLGPQFHQTKKMT